MRPEPSIGLRLTDDLSDLLKDRTPHEAAELVPET
jgi:hypothetical protein